MRHHADLFFLMPSVSYYLACFMRIDLTLSLSLSLSARKEMKQKVDDYLRHHSLGPLFEVLAGHADCVPSFFVAVNTRCPHCRA